MRLAFPEAARVLSLTDIGLYIHIPFCKRKCAYCDFYSLTMWENLLDEYLSALTGDIKKWGGLIDRPIDSIYIGGGTPSILEDKISVLLEEIYNNFTVCENAEITVEVNPDVSDIFLKSAKKSGVNRISIGVQSGNDEMLKNLGRTHTAKQSENAITRIKNAGFENISADLMICLPNSDINSLSQDIDFMFGLDVPHISAYILKVEQKTKFGSIPLDLPNEDSVAEQYLYMCKKLKENGYSHYEISNFAKSGFESKHNLKYWQLKEYLGLGPSAHSFLDGKRFYYPADISGYIKRPATVFDALGGTKEEKLMLGLRLKNGIDLSDFLCDNIDSLLLPFIKNGLINKKGNNISLTDKGMLVSNSIITALSEILL